MNTWIVTHRSVRGTVASMALCLSSLAWSPTANAAAGAQVLDLGLLNGTSGSAGFGISDSGRTAGTCNDQAFRTAPNSAINGSPGSSDSIHAFLQLASSRAYDIRQGYDGSIGVVGEVYDTTNWRPFWYFESSNGAQRVSRLLHDGVGGAFAVIPPPGVGYATAVVGWARVNSVDNAAYWSVVTNQHWLYNYGNNFFPNTNSYATDTDGNRTVGYFGNTDVTAFILHGSIRSLSTPTNATGTAAIGMRTVGTNSRVVGYYTASGLMKPISWFYSGNGSSTHTTLSLPSGKTQGIARGVNDLGDIVGSAWSTDFSDEVACVWPEGGSVQTANSIAADANWNLIRAYKINSDSAGRKVVGYGTHTVGGVSSVRGFVLSSWD